MNISKVKVKKFVDERDWNKSHSPKNLAMSIAIEAAELMEIFQWIDIEQSKRIMETKEEEHVKEEIADIMIYCLSLCNQLDLDPNEIIDEKIEKNAIKYPVEKDNYLDK